MRNTCHTASSQFSKFLLKNIISNVGQKVQKFWYLTLFSNTVTDILQRIALVGHECKYILIIEYVCFYILTYCYKILSKNGLYQKSCAQHSFLNIHHKALVYSITSDKINFTLYSLLDSMVLLFLKTKQNTVKY